jgi:hypothetical protein
MRTHESIMAEWCKNHPNDSKYHEDLLRLARLEDLNRQNKLFDDAERLKEVLSQAN